MGASSWALVLLAGLITPVTQGSGVKNFFGFFGKPTVPTPTESPSESRSCNCECGVRNEGSRIVGGNMADTHEFPWMVRLSYFNRFYCGGTLVNDRYVVTAAHCVKGFMWFLIKVTFGEHSQCNKTALPETRFVLRATIGDFSFFNFRNDIAVLRLNDRIPISNVIRPICLPTDRAELYHNRVGTVTGWGTTKEGGTTSCELQEVDMPIMTNAECQRSNYTPSMIADTMLCAGYKDGGKDSCQGDSGGPLTMERADKKYELIGVVSWGNGCARPGYPGVYTRVTHYIDWIRDHAKDGCFCEQAASQTTR